MASGIIVIAAALIPFIIQVIRAKMAKDASQLYIEDKNDETINKAIINHDGTSASILLDTILTRLQDNTNSVTK